MIAAWLRRLLVVRRDRPATCAVCGAYLRPVRPASNRREVCSEACALEDWERRAI